MTCFIIFIFILCVISALNNNFTVFILKKKLSIICKNSHLELLEGKSNDQEQRFTWTSRFFLDEKKTTSF